MSMLQFEKFEIPNPAKKKRDTVLVFECFEVSSVHVYVVVHIRYTKHDD